MDNNSLTNFENPLAIVDPQSQLVTNFLSQLGLPTEGIIAPLVERQRLGQNLLPYLNSIDITSRRDAKYLSKFLVGGAFGIFDYSLNAIWNQVIETLHKQIDIYGLDFFFDAAVGGKNRSLYQTKDDLNLLKDNAILDTCFKLELLSAVTYKKLKHMLDMRNHVGISHPNDEQIKAFDLLSWLSTCVEEVINNTPSQSAIHVKQLITNLKQQTSVLAQPTIELIVTNAKQLNSTHIGNILKTLFHNFCDLSSNPIYKQNINLIAKDFWQLSDTQSKFDLGITLENFHSNLRNDEYTLGNQFFEFVNGNNYKTTNEKTIIIDDLLDELIEKHYGWDNFHNEPAIIFKINSYITNSQDIIPNIQKKLIHNILVCRLGNGVSYNQGVSPRAKPIYDNILRFLNDSHLRHVLDALEHSEIDRLTHSTYPKENLKNFIVSYKNQCFNERSKEIISYILDRYDHNNLSSLNDTAFKLLCAAI